MNKSPESCYNIVKKLLKCGADPNIVSDYLFTPLAILCYYYPKTHLKVIRLLIDNGEDVNYGYDHTDYINKYHAPLVLVCKNEKGNMQLIKLLVYSGANLNKKDKYGMTCFMEICMIGNDEYNQKIVKFLIDNDADINVIGIGNISPLTCALIKGNNKIAKILQEYNKHQIKNVNMDVDMDMDLYTTRKNTKPHLDTICFTTLVLIIIILILTYILNLIF